MNRAGREDASPWSWGGVLLGPERAGAALGQRRRPGEPQGLLSVVTSTPGCTHP